MKKIIFALLISSLFFSNYAVAYTGCRQVTGEYSTVLFEKYGIDVGHGKTISLVLRCEGDCFVLNMLGAVSGSATKCGETDPDKGTWAYSSCGGIKHTDYGEGVQGVANAMLRACQ